MGSKSSNDQYSDEEATRRMNEALHRALTSPPKPHKEMKIGKRKAKAEPGSRRKKMPRKLAAISGGLENGHDRLSRLLNQEQLVLLRNAVDGSVFDTPDGLGFKYIKTFVEVASGISPKFFSHFIEGFRERADHHSRISGNQ
jgi:hypothetical protein